ncbi:DoxX family protein [Thalassospira xiamenensis]|uniref:Putative oxidoreductase n=1 Tax=Thalassospira xiamenensis TaxID=220697 RepID=A0A285TY08_9PROT|nr:DoxX family protein [Thalassospira xiamenensis]SOC31033.1 putative oxidoreductase [Thalassospira xiamenensis]
MKILFRLYVYYEKITDKIPVNSSISLISRIVFSLVLFNYYLGSFSTKFEVGPGLDFSLTSGAFAQILPDIADKFQYNVDAIPFFPWHIIVASGTIAELTLPLMIVAGFMTRLSALAMLFFVAVQTFVDIYFHGAEAGRLFNGLSGELIDQRLLWEFLIGILALVGGGKISVDHLLRNKFGKIMDVHVERNENGPFR